MATLLPQIRDVRRIGSCALDLCMVAAGRLDAYYEDGVHVWDWAAGALIAAEAGAGGCGRPGQRRTGSDGRGRAGCRRRRSTRPLLRCGLDDCGGSSVGRSDRVAQQVAGVDLGEQRRVGAAGSASGRRLASTASMSSLWVSSVKSVPIARSTVSSVR